MTDPSKDMDYLLPWNAEESERLNFQHRMLCRIFGGLLRAPIEKTKVRRVLELGCGTSIWMADMAREYPNAEFVGVDLNRWPDWKDAPANCSFKVGNLETDAVWQDLGGSFDVIHVRFLVAGIKDWPALVKRCSAQLAPGGWFESQELDLPIGSERNVTAKESKFVEFHDLWLDGMKQSGMGSSAVKTLPAVLAKAGLGNVGVEEFKMRLGPWTETEEERELSEMGTKDGWRAMFESGKKIFLGPLGWSENAYLKFTDEALEDLKTRDARIYGPMKVAFAQKT